MKRNLTLVLMMLLAGATVAFADVDDTYQFVDKDGNILADGAEWVASEAEEDDWGAVQVPTQLFVKKNSDDVSVLAKVECTIEEMPAGSSLQCCFPSNCMSYNSVGIWANGPGQYGSDDFQTEWFAPTDDNYNPVEGTCKVLFQLFACTKKTFGTGYNETPCASIHVTFVYSDSNGITAAETAPAGSDKWYDLQGRELQTAPGRGIFIHNGKKYVK